MSIISPPGAAPGSRDAARSQWSFGRVLASAIVILIGIAVGGFVGILVGFAMGWIEINC
jgi:ABC-type nitrate/sulfonate/bicarbonate transport system permease component